MAGATLHITFDSAEVMAALNRLADAAHDATPLMRDLGEYLLRTTRDRFASETAPDGTPWAPLSEVTRGRKRRNVGKILTESGTLGGSGLVYQARRDRVEVGSPLIYAGTHQLGAERGAFGSMSNGAPIPWGDIPARPFLGLSGDDTREIVALVNDYMEGALKGSS